VSEVYSHSRLASFESCPKKFHYRYVERIPAEKESIEAFTGKRVHEVLERLYKAVADARVPSIRRVLDRFRALWNEHFDADRLRIARAENGPELYRENGERCLTNHYHRHYPFDRDETLGLEQRVAFALDPDGRYRVQGVIDRVVRARDPQTGDERIEIHDYKTAARVPRQDDLDRDRQLALYQMGVAQQYGNAQPIRLVWHYLLPNQVRTSERTPEQLAALREETIGLIDRIRAEERWAPRPGPLCRWCEYAEICPASGVAAAPSAPLGDAPVADAPVAAVAVAPRPGQMPLF
jgi:putative RecB family exonuclease